VTIFQRLPELLKRIDRLEKRLPAAATDSSKPEATEAEK